MCVLLNTAKAIPPCLCPNQGTREQLDSQTNLGDPAAQVIWVGHGSRHTQQLDMAGTVDDDLLPHSAPACIAQIVHLHCHIRLELKSTASLSMPIKAVCGVMQTRNP